MGGVSVFLTLSTSTCKRSKSVFQYILIFLTFFDLQLFHCFHSKTSFVSNL